MNVTTGDDGENNALATVRLKGGLILYDPTRVDQPGPAFFDAEAWCASGQAEPADRGRGSAWFLDTEDGWVLRHYRRGGLVARFNRDQYLFFGYPRSRPLREIRLLARMRAQQLPVPAPVAAAVWRSGLCYRGDLITGRVPGRPLSARLNELDDPRLWARLGELIRRFHEQGVDHADLNLHNILLADDGALHLIDFDRGRIRPSGRWQRRNLERLQRSLRKCLGARWQEEPHWRQCWLALEKAWAKV